MNKRPADAMALRRLFSKEQELMRSVSKHLGVLGLVISLVPLTARANPENAVQYDARSLAMGGTGTAFLTGPTGGVYFNPALLDGVENLGVALTLTPFFPSLRAPLAQPGTVAPTQNAETEFAPIPLFLGAAGFRVHERVAVGLGVYVAAGLVAKYEDVGIFDADATPESARDDFDDMDLDQAILELAVPISVRLTPKLSVGASWRAAYMTREAQLIVPSAAGPGLVNRVEQSLDGTSLLGGMLGLRYQANELLSFGVSYRTKMTIDLEGKTDFTANAAPPMAPTAVVADAPTTSTWSTPHQLRAGAALSLLGEQLLLVLEGRVQLYKETNRDLTSKIDLQGQPLMAATGESELTTSSRMEWNNSYTLQAGAEYWLIPKLALRLGLTAGNSATSRNYPSPLTPPPGLLYAVTAGLGVQWAHWEAGIGVALGTHSEDIRQTDIATTAEGVPAAPGGTYGGSAAFVALSTAYRM